MSGSTNQIAFLSSVHERETHKGINITKNRHEGERWGKECEVRLGRKWTKIRAKIVSDDSEEEPQQDCFRMSVVQ